MAVLLATLVLIPSIVSAQQPRKKASDEIDWHCEANEGFQALCRKMEQQAKDANALKEAAENLGKLRASDKDEQIDGTIGLGKDANSNANGNAVSKYVTDKSLGVVGKVAHTENAKLNEVAKMAEQLLSSAGSSKPSFYGQSHTLNERIDTQKNQEILNLARQAIAQSPAANSSNQHPAGTYAAHSREVPPSLLLRLTSSEETQIQQELLFRDEVRQKRLAEKKAAEAKIAAEEAERKKEEAELRREQRRESAASQYRSTNSYHSRSKDERRTNNPLETNACVLAHERGCSTQ